MAKFVIIGGGLSGIASAVFLTHNQQNITLLEASPKLGGKAYSFQDKITENFIDNGQHILIGAYNNTFELLKILKVENRFYYQPALKVNYVNRNKEKIFLNAKNKFYPFNLLGAILRFNILNFNEKMLLIKLFSKLPLVKETKIKNKTVLEWLKDNKQSENSVKMFWELLTVSVMNTPIKEASAKVFVSVLKKLFMKGNKASRLIIPQYGLSEIFTKPAKQYLQSRKAEINLSEKVVSIKTDGEKIKKIITIKKEYTDFDYVISAVPFYSLKKILPKLSFESLLNNKITFSPIITVHLWLNKKLFEEKFYGLLNSKIHWIFNNVNHISLVISSAEKLIKLDSKKIFQICIYELKNYFPKIKNLKILHYKVIKEKRATFKSSVEYEKVRNKIISPYKNLQLAGDWTNTKLPATIEGAILSGKKVLQILSKP